MENTDDKNFVSHNSDKPLIRTMADDLKKIKNGLVVKSSAPASYVSSSVAPAKPSTTFNKIKRPNLSSVSVPIPAKTNILAPESSSVAIKISDFPASKNLPKENPLLVKKAEQIRREKEKIEQEIIRKEKEIIAQTKAEEAEEALATAKKRDEKIRLEKEKAEQARLENERIEKVKKEKIRIEKERIRKEKERLAQIEAAKELEKQRKTEEEIRIEKEKAERIKKEQEMIEQAKKDEAIKIRKKLAEEIKKEMEEEIIKEKEKAEQIKIEMELEIKKEMEEAERIKREREDAMKKRVTKVIKEEMEEEIAKEKEKAEQIKREVEMEIKKETEEDLEKEKELEKEIKKEMAIDMRKEIAERHKKIDKKTEEEISANNPIKKEAEPAMQKQDNRDLPKANVSTKTARPISKTFNIPENLPISQAAAMNRLRLNKIRVDEENKKAEQALKEETLAIARKRDEKLRQEKEKIEQFRIEREKIEIARIEKDKQKLVRIEDEKETDQVNSKSRDINSDLGVLNRGGLGKSNSFGREFANENKKEIIAPVFSPVETVSRPMAPVVANRFAKKQNSVGYLMDDVQDLSPEARLARQTSSGSIDSEYRESLIIPPSMKNAPEIRKQTDKIISPPETISSPKIVSPPKKDKIELFMSHSANFKKKSIEKIIKEENPSSFLKKIIKSIIAVLIIVGIAAGIYYFYVSGKSAVNQFSATVPSEPYIGNVTETSISVDSSANINNEIKLYFSNQSSSGIFRLTIKEKDWQNSLGLENFGKSLNIILPDYIAGALEKDYNLAAFNYPEKKYLRLGLVLKVKNPSDISGFAKNWETDMYKDVKPIFIDNPGTYEEGKNFGNNRYGDFNIKYLPLGAENISLNYAIDSEKKFLLITTSKDDMYILIDKIIK